MGIERRADRLAYTRPDSLLPELHHVGWTRPRTADALGLGPHAHVGWEICWLRRGSVDWWAGERSWHVPQGSIYITLPKEQHGGVHAVLGRCELFWLMLAPVRGALPGMDPAHSRACLAALRGLRSRIVAGGDALTDAWWRLLRAARDRPPHAALHARAALHEILALVLDAVARHVEPPPPSPPIAAAQQHALARLDRDCPVGELARAAGLSPSRFHDRFLAEVGDSPGDWARQQRIAAAKRQLATGDTPITALAHRLGFGSSQYFATAFRRYVGLTPRAYRRLARVTPT